MYLRFTIAEISSVISPELKRSRDLNTYFGGNLSRMLAKFDVHYSFTRSKDMKGPRDFKNGSRDPDHANLRVVCRPKTI